MFFVGVILIAAGIGIKYPLFLVGFGFTCIAIELLLTDQSGK